MEHMIEIFTGVEEDEAQLEEPEKDLDLTEEELDLLPASAYDGERLRDSLQKILDVFDPVIRSRMDKERLDFVNGVTSDDRRRKQNHAVEVAKDDSEALEEAQEDLEEQTVKSGKESEEEEVEIEVEVEIEEKTSAAGDNSLSEYESYEEEKEDVEEEEGSAEELDPSEGALRGKDHITKLRQILAKAQADYEKRVGERGDFEQRLDKETLPEDLREPWSEAVRMMDEKLRMLRLAQIFDPYIEEIRDALNGLVEAGPLKKKFLQAILRRVQHAKIENDEEEVDPIEILLADDEGGLATNEEEEQEFESEATNMESKAKGIAHQELEEGKAVSTEGEAIWTESQGEEQLKDDEEAKEEEEDEEGEEDEEDEEGEEEEEEEELEAFEELEEYEIEEYSDEDMGAVRFYISELKQLMSLMTHTVTVVEEHNSAFVNSLISWVLEWIALHREPLRDSEMARSDTQWYQSMRNQLKGLCKSAEGFLEVSQGEELDRVPKSKHAEILGFGGFATVVKVKFKKKPAAMKMFNVAGENLTDKLADFKQELEVWKAVSEGENILNLYGFGLDSKRKSLVLVCELASRSLHDSLLVEPILKRSSTNVKGIGGDIVNGLQYMHDMGFIHADVKPRNVLLFENGSRRAPLAKLADFGISKRVDGVQLQDDYMGTEDYMGPEVFAYCVAASSDIFALGVTLRELIDFRMNGKEMDDATTQYFFKHDIEIENCNVSPELVNLLKKCYSDNFTLRPSLKACAEVLQSSSIYVDSSEPRVGKRNPGMFSRVASIFKGSQDLERPEPSGDEESGLLNAIGKVTNGVASVSKEMVKSCTSRLTGKATVAYKDL